MWKKDTTKLSNPCFSSSQAIKACEPLLVVALTWMSTAAVNESSPRLTVNSVSSLLVLVSGVIILVHEDRAYTAAGR